MRRDSIETLSSEFNSRLSSYFKTRSYTLILYGSSVWGEIESDLDFCIITHSYENEDINNLWEIFKKFNHEFDFADDNEVPFENKCIYTFYELEKVLRTPPFKIIKNKYNIEPVSKTREYLSSNIMRERLLLNILTNNVMVVNENSLDIKKYQKRAWKSLIPIIFSNEMNEWLSIDEFITHLYKNPFGEEKGDFYLGYDINNIKLYEYLKESISTQFKELTDQKELLEKEGEYKYDSDKLDKFVFSKILTDDELKLKEYTKMKFYDFSENSNPFGPSENVQNAVSNCWKYINTYPDYKNIEENKKLSDFFNINEENICICNGSLEAIFAIPEIIESKNAAVIVPTYWGYEAALKHLNIQYSKYNIGENLEYNPEFIADIAKKHDLLFICNPNNPTSSYIYKKDIHKIVSENPQCHFIMDESHLLLHDNYELESLQSEVNELNNLSIVYSLSKFFSVASLRVGAVISNKSVIQQYKEWQVPYSLSTLSQVLFNVAIEDKYFAQFTRSNIHKIVDGLYKELKEIEWLEPKPSITNFVLCKIKYGISAVELAETLERSNIYVRELTTSYPDIGGEWIRISVNTPDLNQYLIGKLKEVKLNL